MKTEVAELLGLLRACKEAVEDDGPRLILADWLEEHGQPDRAEFVRVQVRRHRVPEWDARQTELARREAELLRRHHAEWLGPLAGRCSVSEFRRSMISATVERLTP